MQFHSTDELLEHLPLSLQYQELKQKEETARRHKIAKQRGSALCALASLIMGIAIAHPGFNQWCTTQLQLYRIVTPHLSALSSRSNNGDKIAVALVEYARLHGWEVRTGERRFNIFYVNGMSPQGMKNNRNAHQFSDARFLVEVNPKPRLVGAWKATTRPSIYYVENSRKRNGPAQVPPGFYAHKWRIGVHRYRELALVQAAPLTVIRDTNRNFLVDGGDTLDTGMFGINQHSNNNPQTASAGCLVQEGNQQEFMSYLQQDADYQKDRNFLFSSGIISAEELNL